MLAEEITECKICFSPEVVYKDYCEDCIDKKTREAASKIPLACQCCGETENLIEGLCPEYGDYWCPPCNKNAQDGEGRCDCEG